MNHNSKIVNVLISRVINKSDKRSPILIIFQSYGNQPLMKVTLKIKVNETTYKEQIYRTLFTLICHRQARKSITKTRGFRKSHNLLYLEVGVTHGCVRRSGYICYSVAPATGVIPKRTGGGIKG